MPNRAAVRLPEFVKFVPAISNAPCIMPWLLAVKVPEFVMFVSVMEPLYAN